MTSVQHAASQASSPVKGLNKSSTSVKGEAASSDLSGEFASLFGALIEGMPGQDLATPEVGNGPAAIGLAGDSVAKPPSAESAEVGQQVPAVGLAAEVLGPSVHIITSTEPAISDDSLMAFARGQGLDEDALAMIFGPRAAPELPINPTALVSADAAVTPNNSALTAHELLAAQVFSGKAGRPTQSTALAADALNHSAALPAQASADGSETLDLGPEARLSWRIGEHAASNTAPNVASSTLPSALFGLNGVRAMPAAAPVAPVAQMAAAEVAAEVAAHPEAANQSLAASLILGAAEASQFARRQQTKQISERAERIGDLLNLSNTSTTAAANSSATASSLTEVVSEVLPLDTGLSETDLQQLMQQRQPDGRQPSGQPLAEPSAAAATAASDLDLRAEQYDRLSQRLAEALGQRLAAQIARGDWKVEMALRPKDLGNIDIELHMKRGELQASFSASQLGTRDLIAEGLPRLREVLTQLGMEVASVDVNVRQESQHGGNSTPGRQPTGTERVGSGRSAVDSRVADPLPPARSSSSSDGLDVLV